MNALPPIKLMKYFQNGMISSAHFTPRHFRRAHDLIAKAYPKVFAQL